uniref:Spindle pole body component n=1 Tax=Blastobotrys adeninivorans TaxID=409370 RepID=A0A060TCX2_BLAAD
MDTLFRVDHIQWSPVEVEDKDGEALEQFKDPFGLTETVKNERVRAFNQLTVADIREASFDPISRLEVGQFTSSPPKGALSWDEYYGVASKLRQQAPRDQSLATRMLSERPCWQFDAVISTLCTDPGPLFPLSFAVQSLLDLALGKESSLFSFSHKKMRFVCERVSFRVSGCSSDSVRALTDICITCGSQFRRLLYTSQRIEELGNSPVLIAFAECVSGVLSSVERAVSKSMDKNVTLLRLNRLIMRPAKVVDMLAGIVGCRDITVPIQLNRLPKAYRLLSEIYARLSTYQNCDPHLYALTRIIFSRTCAPWLSFVQDLIGLGRQETFWRPLDFFTNYSDSFVTTKQGSKLMHLVPDALPTFISLDQAQKIIETFNCFILYSRFGDREWTWQLSSMDSLQVRLCYNYEQLDVLKGEVVDYNRSLRDIAHDNARAGPSISARMDEPEASIVETDDLVARMEEINLRVPESNEHVPDEIEICCNDLFENSPHMATDPPMEVMIERSLSVTVTAQCELANEQALKLYHEGKSDISAHNLLIQGLFLMSNGTFVVNLEHQLFDAQDGLQLDNRENWPPSTAEINSTLSGITTDAIEEILTDYPTLVHDMSLNVNFGLDKKAGAGSTNANELGATDNLKLVYSVGEPIDVILTPAIVAVYQQLFSQLLRILRLVRTDKKRQLHQTPMARDFVRTIAHHLSTTVPQFHWRHKPQFQTLGEMIQAHKQLCLAIAKDSFVYNKHFESLLVALWNQEPVDHRIHEFLNTLDSRPMNSLLKHLLGVTTISYKSKLQIA